ncbi:MAG: hypothetical protein JWO38_4947 [Gemmataceae bacterium]|nr:hypothetical protein [Gemmataceae bacterium]
MGGLDLQAAHALADRAGVGPVRAVAPMAGGANNRVFRLDAAAGTFLLKSYFRHPDDPRDRLAAEFAFSRFAWDNGVRCIPQPLASDPQGGLGLFEFVFGRSLHGAIAGEAAVDQAVDFYRTLNRAKNQPAAAALPRASESCFTLDDHFATVNRRVERLQTMPVGGMADEAAAWVGSDLVPAWRQVLATARAAAAAHGLLPDEVLADADRCLSPSDFGFHNALLAHDGRLRFIDFEYAGWDDPSKLICDFFCQPAVPAPPLAFDRFAAAVAAELADPTMQVARATLLLPVYRVKWVCIMLNEFLPVGGSRRAFSGTAAEQETRKTSQLAKARAALAAVLSTSFTPRKVA